MNQQLPPTKTEQNQRQTTQKHPLQRYGLLIILLIFTGLSLLYDFTVPLFEKPDEFKHFAVIQFIQNHAQLPVVKEGVSKPWDQEGTQPPFYHLLAATAWLNLDTFTEPPRNPHYADDRSFVWQERGNNNLYLHPPNEPWDFSAVLLTARIARWLSLLAGVGTIIFTYLLAKTVFLPWPNNNCPSVISKSIPWLAAAMVAFIPQFIHVSSAISNDGLSTTLAAATLFVLVRAIKNGLSTGQATILGFLLGLGAITKLSLLYLIFPVGFVFLYAFYQQRLWGHLLKFGVITGGLMLLLSGWWLGRNWQLYGDISALNAHLLYRGGALNPPPTLAQIWQTEMVGLELSFWAAFGAGQILVEPWIYSLLQGLKYVILLGIGLGVWPLFRKQKTTNPQQNTVHITITLALLAMWVVIIFVALLRWMQITPASWGRLLYPALPAIAVLSAWGISHLAQVVFRFANYLAGKLSRPHIFLRLLRPCLVAHLFMWILPTGLFLLALSGPLYYLPTAYAKIPLLAESSLPAEITPLDFLYPENALRLIGFHIGQDNIQPGQWLPVTLYWQATEPVQKNYSAFVHVLDPTGLAIGQSNSYPAGGNWPTTMLTPGQVLVDTHYIFIPLNAETPVATRLTMGIFEFDDPQRAAKVALNPTTGDVVEAIVEGIPLHPQQWPQLHPKQSLAVNFADQIKLVGVDPIAKKIKPGATIPLTLYWDTVSPPGQNLNLFIHLIESATQTQAAGFDAPPHFPTKFWQIGNTFIDTRTLTIPDNLPPGEYDLHIGWYNLDNLARLPIVDGEDSDTLRLMTVSVE